MENQRNKERTESQMFILLSGQKYIFQADWEAYRGYKEGSETSIALRKYTRMRAYRKNEWSFENSFLFVDRETQGSIR